MCKFIRAEVPYDYNKPLTQSQRRKIRLISQLLWVKMDDPFYEIAANSPAVMLFRIPCERGNCDYTSQFSPGFSIYEHRQEEIDGVLITFELGQY